MKFQEPNCTISKNENEIIFCTKFHSQAPAALVKKHGIFNILNRESRNNMQISIFPKFRP